MRTKRALYNFLSDLIPLIILTFIGLFKANIFIKMLGTEVNGLYGNFIQIMTYLSIVDGGLGSAILYKLYKPISEKDDDKISEILSGSKRIFQIVALIIFIMGIIISFFIPLIINDNSFTNSYIQFTFVLYLISSLFSYFTITNQIIFEGFQKKYIPNIILQFFAVLKGILEIVVISKGGSLEHIISVLIIINLISSFSIYCISKKYFSNIVFNSKKKDYSILKDVKHLMVHKIGGIIAYNIDIVIITSFISLTSASIYSQYLYIINSINTIINKIALSITAGVGELIVRSKEKSYEIFKELNSLSFFIAMVICIPLYFSLNPFIELWHQGRINTATIYSAMFVLNLTYFTIRMPLITFSNSAGLFKETKICTILESIINLSLSLILVNYFGIAGVLIATFTAYIISDYFIRPSIIYKNVLEKNVSEYYFKNFIYIFMGIILIISGIYIYPTISSDSYLLWFIDSCIVFVANMILTIILFKIFKQGYFFRRIDSILIKIRNKGVKNEKEK